MKLKMENEMAYFDSYDDDTNEDLDTEPTVPYHPSFISNFGDYLRKSMVEHLKEHGQDKLVDIRDEAFDRQGLVISYGTFAIHAAKEQDIDAAKDEVNAAFTSAWQKHKPY